MHLRLAYIRLPVVILLHRLIHSFELTAPYVLQVRALRPRRRRFIKKHRNAIAPPDLISNLPGQRHAIFQRYSFHWNKRHHVRSAHPRMRALVLGHVDQFQRSAGAQDCRFRHRLRISRQRNHAPVVIRVHLVIQHPHSGHLAHRLDQRRDLRGIAPLAKIRHTLNQSSHISIASL